MIEIKNLHKSYEMGATSLHVLKGINFSVKDGELVAIMGSSGSGKSTLLNILGMLDTSDAGTYDLDNIRIANMDETKAANYRNRFLGFVFQSFNLISRLTSLANVEIPLSILGISSKRRKKRSYEMLKMVGLGDRWHHKPNELSGGEQQRVAIARALSTNPSIILGDEPTGNLDSKTGSNIIKLLKELNTTTGKTVILITHDSNIAREASRVISVRDGKIEDYNLDLENTIKND